jgi:hypothetical protein
MQAPVVVVLLSHFDRVAVGAKQLQAIALTSDAPIQWLTAIVPPGGREMHHAHRHNVIKLQRAIVVETALHAFSTHQAYSLAPQPFAISLPPIRIIAFAPRLDPCIPKPA